MDIWKIIYITESGCEDEELLLKLDNDFCSYGERKDGDRNG